MFESNEHVDHHTLINSIILSVEFLIKLNAMNDVASERDRKTQSDVKCKAGDYPAKNSALFLSAIFFLSQIF